jgi:hypothetical protein
VSSHKYLISCLSVQKSQYTGFHRYGNQLNSTIYAFPHKQVKINLNTQCTLQSHYQMQWESNAKKSSPRLPNTKFKHDPYIQIPVFLPARKNKHSKRSLQLRDSPRTFTVITEKTSIWKQHCSELLIAEVKSNNYLIILVFAVLIP